MSKNPQRGGGNQPQNRQQAATPAVPAQPTPTASPEAPVVDATAPVETPAVDTPEVPATPETPEVPAVKVAAETVATPAPPALKPLYEYLKSRFPTLVDFPPVVGQLESILERYVTDMGKRQPVSRDNAIERQQTLYYAMMTAVGAGKGEHFIAMETVMFYFKTYANDSFQQELLFRFNNELRLYKEQLNIFSSLITLFLATNDPSKRKHGLRFVNLQKMADQMPDAVYRNNLTTFFSN